MAAASTVAEPANDLDAIAVYRRSLRDRLAGESCHACHQTLHAADFVRGFDGSAFDEYGLGQAATAEALAATEHVIAVCAHCGTENHVGPFRGYGPAPTRVPEPPQPWPAEAVAAHDAAIQDRLRQATCSACGASFAGVKPTSVSGGNFEDAYGLSDTAQARWLALTECIKVTCRACGTQACLQ